MIGKIIQEKNKKTTRSFQPNKTGIVDVSNLFWIVRFSKLGQSQQYDPDGVDFVFQEVFKMIFYLKKKMNCDEMILAFDGPNVWRKKVFPEYKKGRKSETDIYKEELFDRIQHFYSIFDEYTNIICLKAEEAEADDIISVYVQNKQPNEEVYILSGDRDFIQLIDNDVFLFDPVKSQFRQPEEGIEEDLFIKCFRGDRGDNIPNIYPRIRKTKLLSLLTNSYERMNIMETYNSEFNQKVGDLFEVNQQLIDLKQQPTYIRQNIYDLIQTKIYENKYDQIGFLNYLRYLDMKNLIENHDKYAQHLK